jgi:hypothetical protein
MTDTNQANKSIETEKTKSEISFEWAETSLPFLAGLFIVVLLAIYFSKFNEGFGDNNAFGTFGDFIGGALNPLLGFLTVWLLIKSIRFQIDELKLTRLELQETRAELSRTAEANESSAKIQELSVKIQQTNLIQPILNHHLNSTLQRELDNSLALSLEMYQNQPKGFIANGNRSSLKSLLEFPKVRAEELIARGFLKSPQYQQNLNFLINKYLQIISAALHVLRQMQAYDIHPFTYYEAVDNITDKLNRLSVLLDSPIDNETARNLVNKYLTEIEKFTEQPKTE